MSEPVLRPARSLSRVFLYRDPVDFRKSYRGLSALVELELGHSPFSGDLYAFINRDHSRIKLLFWERSGFVLYYKALVEEKFRWPRFGEQTMTLDGQALNWLLDGIDIASMTPHRQLSYKSVA